MTSTRGTKAPEEECQICEKKENLIDTWLKDFTHINDRLQAVINPKENYNNWFRFICESCKNQLEQVWDFVNRCKTAYKIFLVQLEEDNFCSPSGTEIEAEIDNNPIIFTHHSGEDNKSNATKEEIEYSNLEALEVLPNYEEESPKRRINFREIVTSFTCCLCDKKYTRKAFLKAHVEIVHLKIRKRNHLCDICGKNYLYGYQLSDHMKKHRGHKEKFTCELCQSTLSSRKGLWTHLQLHKNPHKREKRSRTCEHCGAVTEGKAAFYEHLKTHSTIPRHQCHYCPKTFNFLAILREHERIHTGEEPYQCKICSKTFKQKSHLNRHINVHTGERRYSCTYCDKVFTENGTLKVHTRIHTGETPFECELCSKKFHERKSWRNHTIKCSKLVICTN